MGLVRVVNATLTGFLMALLAACGGGGGDSGAAASPNSPNLVISSVGPREAVGGGSSTYVDITLSNSGTEAASGVSLTTSLGNGLAQGVVSCTSSPSAKCPSTLGSVFNIGSLPADSSLIFRVALGVASGSSGSINSTASFTASNVPAATSKTTSFAISAYSADIQVTGKSASVRVIEGGAVSYSVTISNAGPDTARNLTIANLIDSGQTLGAMMCSATGGAVCPSTLGAAMKVELLPKDASITLVLPAAVQTTGVTRMLLNQLTVQAEGDPVIANNSASMSLEATAPNSVRLQSDSGDYIGGGQSYQYTQVNSRLAVIANDGRLSINVTGDESWSADFQLPGNLARFQSGTYSGLSRFPFHSSAIGGLNWSGEGRGCNTLKGSFTVSRAVYQNGALQAIDPIVRAVL